MGVLFSLLITLANAGVENPTAQELSTAKSLYSASYVNAYRKCMYNFENSSTYKALAVKGQVETDWHDNWNPAAHKKWKEAVTKKKLSCGAKFVAALDKAKIPEEELGDDACRDKSQYYKQILSFKLEDDAFYNSNPKWASLDDNGELFISWMGCYKNGAKYVCVKTPETVQKSFTESPEDDSLEKAYQTQCQQKKDLDACVKAEYGTPGTLEKQQWLALPLSDRKKKCEAKNDPH